MSQDAEGHSQLHSASMYSNAEIIGEFLSAGTGITTGNKCDATPLHSAASRTTIETIKALPDGADVMAAEADSWTLSHCTPACF